MDMDISTFHIKSVDCGNVVQFGWPRVCLSVRPSDRSRYCIKMAKRRITQTTQHDSSFLTPIKRSLGNSKSAIFDQYLAVLEIMQDMDIVTTEG